MPGNIFTRMFGCFGHVNQVQPNVRPAAQGYTTLPNPPTQPVAPAYTPRAVTFLPGRHHSAAELLEIARINPPRTEIKSAFLHTMAVAFERPSTTRLQKAALCKHISKLMQEDEVLNFKGAPRQANYFASYCIDLNFQELDVAYNVTMENDVREMLNLWTNRLCPAQNEFNLDGVVYSRDEINAMLRNPTLIQRNVSSQNSVLVTQMERALRHSGSQSVHDNAVRTNAVRVMGIMQAKHGQTKEMTSGEITRFLDRAIRQDPRHNNIREGLNHCLASTGFDPNSPGAMTPKRLLGNVCQYIQATSDTAMRSNLTAALLVRLNEINVEHPCVVGVSQRLLDVPNGIDPDMNFAGRAVQVEQDVAALAGKTYNQFSDLVDEGLQAIQEIEKNEKISGNDETITDLGQNMFQTRLKNDLNRLGGISETDIAPHRERLKTGFTSPS
ncbi:MAG: hypothetical protein KJ798_07955 [Gammaproteobacteria bacterium]|nr:hypothetical protein [Gammaproteobacteria bacterium]MBU0848487.1 hypothetical protein [Gammaproteobacteria bacterium]MBU1267376.1 hypothetical protein [Gammaproteobacteria bacterium]MBU1530401.1 hypothetical protein [Gammaproteobacteria bacterium]MBU1780304.1 hypothetical protein [Gammaproteobacteria bacterium]